MKNKFEVGDIVRSEGAVGHRVGTVQYRDNNPKPGQEHIYHVRYNNEGCEIKEFSMKWHKPEELTLVSWRVDEDVELVEVIEHTGKFKQGDRVKVVSAVLPAHIESIGKEGKIKGIWVNGLYRYTVQFDDGDVTLRNFNEVQLELIEGEEIEPQVEFKALEVLMKDDNFNIRSMLYEEIHKVAVVMLGKCMKENDFNEVKDVIDILKGLACDKPKQR